MNLTYFFEILVYELLELMPNIIIFGIVFQNFFAFFKNTDGNLYFYFLHISYFLSNVIRDGAR